MERFERGTQLESCYITNMRKTEDNTENLKKQNNHIKKKSTNAQSFCPYMSLHLSLKDLNSPIDLSRIPVNKGTNSRLGWTQYSDLYEIVHPSLGLISLCLLTGA